MDRAQPHVRVHRIPTGDTHVRGPIRVEVLYGNGVRTGSSVIQPRQESPVPPAKENTHHSRTRARDHNVEPAVAVDVTDGQCHWPVDRGTVDPGLEGPVPSTEEHADRSGELVRDHRIEPTIAIEIGK
jgi:hypothetical protein